MLYKDQGAKLIFLYSKFDDIQIWCNGVIGEKIIYHQSKCTYIHVTIALL